MNEDEKERKLLSLLAPRRSEAFWAAQRARIASSAAERKGPARAWLLAPAAAAALLAVLLVRPQREPMQTEPQVVSAAFIEHLDLLDDMDVLEAVPEEEL
ncbi:MAG TPA: hypothetical protein DCZ93_10195 [Elusimicrobia bacterium]|nr:MAG: hypothetical protein A2X32_07120 [Elusimicrobia bacterium GWC2_64_44]HBB67646.1 hypothetical protein [Elusimicrobiota bacterium]